MKRFLLLIIALLGTMAIASASASAQGGVLCKKAPTNHYCGYYNFYPDGTEIKATLAPETKATLSTLSNTGVLGICAQSSFEAGIAITGGLEQKTQLGFNEFFFGLCEGERRQLRVPQIVSAAIEWKEGTHNGMAWVNLTLENPSPVFSPSLPCEYVVEGPAELIGGTSPKLVFNNAEASKIKNFACPNKAYFSATYNISTPTPLYVEKY